MPDDFTAQFESPLDQPPDVDALVRPTMSWHFSPCTGSPYWAGRARSFDFDPLTDVQTLSDIQDAFREVPLDWDQIPADQLVPTGRRTRPGRFGVYETGGTTGPPKRIVDAGSRLRNVQWHSRLLDEQDFPRAGGNWLHVGPTGPHIMAKDISNLAALREFLCYYIDFDPRWVRRCLADGRR